jgi:hypothetical protein
MPSMATALAALRDLNGFYPMRVAKCNTACISGRGAYLKAPDLSSVSLAAAPKKETRGFVIKLSETCR